jgi:hypothetical protein
MICLSVLLIGVPRQIDTSSMLSKAPLAKETGRAQVLVVVSDHGSGTSNFGESLKKHPCVFDVGESFGAGYMLWSTSKVAECVGKAVNDAMFDSVSRPCSARSPTSRPFRSWAEAAASSHGSQVAR